MKGRARVRVKEEMKMRLMKIIKVNQQIGLVE
jgi:hypothetical protein